MSSPNPKIVERLWGRVPTLIKPAASGANGVVYHVRAGNNEAALKQYSARPGDDRDRLGTETRAVKFMVAHGLDSVASVIDASPAENLVLFEWLSGRPVGTPTPSDIESAVAFVATVAALSNEPGADNFGPASEACLSPDAIMSQLAERRRALSGSAAQNTELAGVLAAHDNAVLLAAKKIANTYTERGWAFDAPLDREQQCLIPADFGFHNTIRETGGRLRFFDFEYFGWDDPVKLIADLILHPAYSLDATQKKQIRDEAIKRYYKTKDFECRLDTLLPAFALRWALIVLNPLRSEQHESASQNYSWDALRAERLQKAHGFINLSEALLRTP